MRPCCPFITLLTDFGLTDTYVGQMHAVLAARAPQVRVVDLTHAIAPQNVLQGAIILEEAVRVCPPGTIHVAVVDPGVGSRRRPIAAEIGCWTFVGPDNGLFSALLRRGPLLRAVELNRVEFHESLASTTFHGRDVFAPVAAALANGHSLDEVGEPIKEPLIQVDLPTPRITSTDVSGKVLWADHFGNLVTNIGRQHLTGTEGTFACTSRQQIRCVGCYAEAEPGELVALVGSGGRWELAVRNGSAKALLGAAAGTPVTAQFAK